MKPFVVYASSAGSGKTWTLAKEFLTLSLQQESSRFRHILAVTFTNKATQEMKDRIIRYLTEFSEGTSGDLGNAICAEAGLIPEQLKIRSRVMLSEILHRYHDFSVSTIDSFFQKVIRAFTREAGLNGNFTLELDTNTPLRAIIGSMMDDLGKDEQLTNWITEFASERLQEGKSWNIAGNLMDFAKVIFTEEFKLREARILESMEAGKPAELQAALRAMKNRSMEQLKSRGQTAMAALSANGITVTDFSNRDSGTAYKFFREWSNGNSIDAGKRVLDAAASADNWALKKPTTGGVQLIALANQQLMALLNEMLKTAATWHTCNLMLRDFSAYGLLAVILRKYQEWKAEQNVLLIADAPQFLNKVIGGSDTPFLYEKTGTRYHHFLIDEFQDTSRLQWMNFRPLVVNALAEGNRNLVVGDVKQSIYRFRGSDPALLSSLATDIGVAQTETKQLSVNYRSAKAVVTFNNLLFETAARLVNDEVGDTRAGEAYDGVAQKINRGEKGHVEVRFFKKWQDVGRELALNTLPHTIEQIQQAGGKPGDITILVRDNKEGTEIVRFLLEYKHSPDAKPDVVYDIVSGESLRLEVADSVSFLLACLKVIARPSETLARGEAVMEWWRIRGVEPRGERITSVWSEEEELMQLQDLSLRTCSVPELTEELIRRFRLGENIREIPYLQAFQDALMEFNAKEKNDLNAFFDWWEDNSAKKSVKMPETTGAMKLYSIHKSKGLEFPYVIIPFCDWNLDHKFNPLLWCEAGGQFESFGLIPIRYGKK
ncbi:MAG: UvrD-helicase domain-containing protein, partial [Bacteroidota bacterium]